MKIVDSSNAFFFTDKTNSMEEIVKIMEDLGIPKIDTKVISRPITNDGLSLKLDKERTSYPKFKDSESMEYKWTIDDKNEDENTIL